VERNERPPLALLVDVELDVTDVDAHGGAAYDEQTKNVSDQKV
jgi:hypothetical protein